jgi:hypothetical protein
MNIIFKEIIDSLDPKYQALLKMNPVKMSNLPKEMPKEGIFLFSEGDRYLYVGRSNNIRRRLQIHSRNSGTHNQTTFAFRISRENTGQTKASYSSSGSRLSLQNEDKFGKDFASVKMRVSQMDIRFVEETDSVRQALLEIYVATVLKTPYNDFHNH